MTNEPGVWGIDLGQCALKAIRLERQEGQIVATAFDYVEHPKILSQPDADPDQLIREALEKFLSRNSLQGDQVAISVPGQSGLARFVKLPPVEEKKIADIVRFEAKQQIPFALEEVVWDYQKIAQGTVTDGFAMETEIGLFAMKRDMVNRYLTHFQSVGVEVHAIQMAPLALCNYVAYDLLHRNAAGEVEGGEEAPKAGKKRCVVGLDIGADSSNLIITDGVRVIWQRPIPLGGNHFTRALTKDLKLTFAKAEHLKRNAVKSPDLKKILASLKPVLNDFVGEVQRSLGYFTNTHRDAQVEYLVGLGNAFRLPGLQRFLQEKLQLEVRKLPKFERLAGDAVVSAPPFTENLASFAVAYGLALQGIGETRLHTNLLPQEVRIERLVRAKKPWAAAAAAALLFGAMAFTLGYFLEIRAYSAANPESPMAKALDGVKKVADEFRAGKSAYDAEEKKVKDEEDQVRSLVAGQEERLNWLALNQFVANSLPRADEKGDVNIVNPDARKEYWDENPKAKEAHKKLREKQAKGITGKEQFDEDSKNLIHFNLEAMDCRYYENLESWWSGLDAEKKKNPKRVICAKEPGAGASGGEQSAGIPGPKGAGWVVELRGYTYNWRGELFIQRVLLNNIAKTAGLLDPPPAAPASQPANTQPAGNNQPAGNGQPAGNAQEEKKPQHPVIGRVDRVLLYDVKASTAFTEFALIGQSVLNGGGATTGGQQGMGYGPGVGTTMKPPGAGAIGTPPGQPANTGGQKLPSLPTGGGSWVPLGSGSGLGASGRPASSGKSDPSDSKLKLTRTEFIILLVWKENTPSDSLMGFKAPGEGGGETPGQQPSGTPNVPGVPGGGAQGVPAPGGVGGGNRPPGSGKAGRPPTGF